MKKDKSTYYQNILRLTLIKASFVFSIFCFSGFNLHVHATVNSVVKTELTESRIRKPVYDLIKTNKLLSVKILSKENTFNIWKILCYGTILKSQYSSYRIRTLLYITPLLVIKTKFQHFYSEDQALPSLH